MNQEYQIHGKIDLKKEFYILYSASTCNYQDWQSILLEYSIKNSVEKDNCQIIKLLTYDKKHKSEKFKLGDDVTYVFPEGFEEQAIGTHFALLNKPHTMKLFIEDWIDIKELSHDAIFICLDTDMILIDKLDRSIFPKRGEIVGHPWEKNHVMFPFIIRAIDLYNIKDKYLEYSSDKLYYKKHNYFCEMYGFTQAVLDNKLKEIRIKNLGSNWKHRDGNYNNSKFYHYCQQFKEEDKKIWWKQDYTSSTLSVPWKRPYAWEKCTDELYKGVLKTIHNLIDTQENNTYSEPRIIYNPRATKLEIYLWGISDNEEYIRENSKYALNTAEKYNLKPNICGLNTKWPEIIKQETNSNWNTEISRFYLIREIIDRSSEDTIFLFMDGFDTLFEGNKEKILDIYFSQNTDILISAEKEYTYQWPEHQEAYYLNNTETEYKFLNAGTIIGNKKGYKSLIDNCIKTFEEYKDGNDQGILGYEVSKILQKKKDVKLDINNELFWVTIKDTNLLKKNNNYNLITKTKPAILHIINGRRENKDIYKLIYNNIMESKLIINNDIIYTVVINLKERKKRLNNFYTRYKKQKYLFGPLSYFEAINGKNIDIPEYWFKFDTYTDHYTEVVPESAYGCYQSHYKILNYFIKQHFMNNLLILEDDAKFTDDFAIYLNKFLNEVPTNWDVLYLGWTNNGHNPNPYKEHSMTPGKEGVLTTIGYIINKKGAKRYLKELDKNPSKTNFLANEPLDCQLTRFMTKMNVYITKKPIIVPDGSKSSIYK